VSNTSTPTLYLAAGTPVLDDLAQTQGLCLICGQALSCGQPRAAFIKPTFMDHDKCAAPTATYVCPACVFAFDERSALLQCIVGKDKPQRMRNYSHFVTAQGWLPLGKGDKRRMQDLLLAAEFPRLAVVAVSGQKHIIFRAAVNPPGATAGWVQLEEQRLWVNPPELHMLLHMIEQLCTGGFSKAEIRSGHYAQYRIARFGPSDWWALEERLRPRRGHSLFDLALFLGQKGDSDGTRCIEAAGCGSAARPLAGHSQQFQIPLPYEHLAAI